MKKNILFTVVLFLSIGIVHGASFKQELPIFIKNLLRKNRISSDFLGYELRDLETSKVIEAFGQTKLFIPASVTKILTSYFALEILGTDHKFTTEIFYSGKIINEKLIGNIYLVGSGDPLLITSHLMNLALTIKMAGIKSVDGHFYFLDKKQKSMKMISKLGLGDQTYNPGLNDLGVNFNRFSIINIKKTSRQILPPLESIHINHSNKRFGPGQNFVFENIKDNDVETWKFDKRKRYKYIVDLPVRKPALFTANLLRLMAKKIGLILPAPTSFVKELPSPLVLVGTHSSIDLFSIASLAMEYSNNLLAEQLLMAAATELSNNKNTYYKSSVQIMKDWLVKKFPSNNFQLETASGLSIYNKITPEYLTHILSKIMYNEYSDRYFLTLFSLSGDSGWLKNRLRNKNSAYNVWAKTGSLDYVNNIAGMITTPKGKNLVFTIFTNDQKKRKRLEGKNSRALNKLRVRSKSFRKKTKSIANNIIEYWLRKY